MWMRVTLALALFTSVAAVAEVSSRDQLVIDENRLLEADDDQTGKAYDEMSHQVKTTASALVTLSVSGMSHQACEILLCEGLKNRFACPGRSADDTIHMTEFPETCPPIHWDGQKITLYSEFPTIDFYQGDPEEMHRSGYERVRKISAVNTGKAFLDISVPQNSQIVFAIAKGPGERFYKKYVWVIRAEQKK